MEDKLSEQQTYLRLNILEKNIVEDFIWIPHEKGESRLDFFLIGL